MSSGCAGGAGVPCGGWAGSEEQGTSVLGTIVGFWPGTGLTSHLGPYVATTGGGVTDEEVV